MLRNIQQGIIDGLHWFVGQDTQDPTFIHITLSDENHQNVYYDFLIVDGPQTKVNMEEHVKNYRGWLNSKRLPEET